MLKCAFWDLVMNAVNVSICGLHDRDISGYGNSRDPANGHVLLMFIEIESISSNIRVNVD